MAERAKVGMLRIVPNGTGDPFPAEMRKAIHAGRTQGNMNKWRLQLSIASPSGDLPEPNGVVRFKHNFPEEMREFIKQKVNLDDWCLELRLLDGPGSDAAGDDDGSVPWLTNAGPGIKSIAKTRGSKTVKRALKKTPRRRPSRSKTKNALRATAKRGASRSKAKSVRSTSKKRGKR